MVIIGAKGHAKDVLNVLHHNKIKDELYFYDDVTENLPLALYDLYPIIRSLEHAKNMFKRNNEFVLGIGNPKIRYTLSKKFTSIGGELTSVISSFSTIGNHDVNMGIGLNVMPGAVISNSVFIGEGSLINAGVLLHHDVSIGQYAEVSPGAIITGEVKIGDFTFIGAGVTILPKLMIGHNVIVGAGALVTKNVPDNTLVMGVPARIVKRLI